MQIANERRSTLMVAAVETLLDPKNCWNGFFSTIEPPNNYFWGLECRKPFRSHFLCFLLRTSFRAEPQSIDLNAEICGSFDSNMGRSSFVSSVRCWK